jgi:flavin reductase (DIM6/NTAB) family NADH-FMN oxidoreductase RutF
MSEVAIAAAATRSATEIDGDPHPEVDRCLSLFRRLVGGVAIVSAQGADGPVGMTASTVTSVSLRPPLLLACLTTGSGTLAAILRSRSFAVQLLGTHQRSLAEDFASRTGPRFAVYDHLVVSGVPLLRGTLGWAVCTLTDARRYGDHVVVVGRVLSTDTQDGQPLVWHAQNFTRLEALCA